jgi:hypothetical protein
MSTVTLVYPKWNKIPEQTEFHLPPHGPVCVAASIPEQYEIRFIDENVDELDFSRSTDVVLLSMMLTCQLPRGKEIRCLGMLTVFFWVKLRTGVLPEPLLIWKKEDCNRNMIISTTFHPWKA